jgi:hypothetical protein
VDLPSITNAPRALSIRGVTYRARALTLEQFGELLAWLEDRTDIPLVPFCSDSARVALATTEGLAVILHLSLLSCQPHLARDQAQTLAETMDADGQTRLMAIAFRRRPGYAPPAEGAGKDLAETDWGIIWEALTQHRADRYGAVGQLTLDQMENHFARGELAGPDSLSMADFQAMYEAANGEGFTELADAT